MGALTSKPYAFLARSWELERIISVDFFDAFCSSVVYEVRGLEFMRVLPFLNDDLNSDWITNKVRFFYDSLKYQRLINPFLMRKSKYGRRKGFFVLDWKRALRFLYYFFRYKSYGAGDVGANFFFWGILGEFNDLVLQLIFRDFSQRLGGGLSDVFVSCIGGGGSLAVDVFDWTSSYYLLKEEISVCLVLGLDLRLEAPILYTLFRRRVLQGRLRIYGFRSVIMNSVCLNIKELPLNMCFLRRFFEGRVYFSQLFFSLQGIIGILVGGSLFNRSDDLSFLLRKWSFLVSNVSNKLNRGLGSFRLVIYSVFEKSSIYTALWLGFGDSVFKRSRIFNKRNFDIRRYSRSFRFFFFSMKKKDKKGRWGFLLSPFFSRFFMPKVVFNLSADNLVFSKSLAYDLFIYQGFNGDRSVNRADLVLPQHAPTEAEGYFVNLFGYLQVSRFVFAPPGLGRDGGFIMELIFKFLSSWVIKGGRRFFKFSNRLYSVVGVKITLDFHVYSGYFFFDYFDFFLMYMNIKNIVGVTLQYDFYRTDSLSRSSRLLSLASKVNRENIGSSSFLFGL